MSNLRPQELRIGNLILLPSKNNKVYEIADGHDIEEFDYSADGLPIPLTDEWKIALGFEKDGFGAYCKDISIFTKSHYTLCFSSDYLYLRQGEGSVRYDDDVITVWNKDIKKEFYVHELQNLYFALTGKELSYKIPQTS